MRVAVISDVHANIVALRAVLRQIEEQRADKIIFLGDLVVNGPRPKEVLDMMNGLSDLVWIKGNTDNWLKEYSRNFTPKSEGEKGIYSLCQYVRSYLTSNEIEMLLSKQDNLSIELDGVKIICVHGSHRSNSEPLGVMTSIENLEQVTNEISEDILLCGHTHLPYLSSINGKKIINPGSVSISLDGEASASYGILEVNHKFVSYTNYRVQYDIDQVINDARMSEFPNVDAYIKKLTGNQ